MKLPLSPPSKDLRRWAPGAIPWASCQPFIENSRAVLIHRPRSVVTHKLSQHKPHISIKCWCGATFSGTKKFTFLDAPPEDSLLCARCEDVAVNAGIQSASELAGKHVHLGCVVPKRLCCVEETTT